MKLKVVISLSTAPSKQLLAFSLWWRCHYWIHKSVLFIFLSCSLTPLCTATCQLFLFTQACILSYVLSSGIFLLSVNTFYLLKIRLKWCIKTGNSPGNSLGDIYGRALPSGKAHKQETGNRRYKSISIYIPTVIWLYMQPTQHCIPHGCSFRIKWTPWRACLGSCCDLNANGGRVWKHWGCYYLHGWLWWTAHSVWGKNQSEGPHSYD